MPLIRRFSPAFTAFYLLIFPFPSSLVVILIPIPPCAQIGEFRSKIGFQIHFPLSLPFPNWVHEGDLDLVYTFSVRSLASFDDVMATVVCH
ncbi:hypothetical protein C1H46_008854 [Malus baccata]|uniref:Uncharacterized protein n=1 Tax=Malus baccata TaxID=106549 RepID=A0A540N3D7_MALBA|nr:hypothetical protein C1H46_008854 [Malus baccata]